jgi:hypothetical protein
MEHGLRGRGGGTRVQRADRSRGGDGPPRETATRARLRTLARAPEDLGYDSLWIGDHIVITVAYESRYPMTPAGKPPWDYRAVLLDLGVTRCRRLKVLRRAVAPRDEGVDDLIAVHYDKLDERLEELEWFNLA